MTRMPPHRVPAGPKLAVVRRAVEELRLKDRAAELDHTPEFPRAEFRELARRGLVGLVTPRSLGGQGLPLPEVGATLFELAYASGATTFAKLSLQPEFCSQLAERGSETLRKAHFGPLLRGEHLVGNQITEPGAGSDVRGLAAEAVPAKGGYRLSGTKSEAAFAVDADSAIVYAQVPKHEGGAGGLTAFLVPQNIPGIHRHHVADLGERWMRRGTVTYRDVVVPTDHRIGAEGEGLAGVLPELNRERALLSLIYLGVARRTLEETVEHVGGREAFGGPLSRQEAVAFPLAESWAEVDAACLYALDVLERWGTLKDGAGEAAMAKWMATEVALRVHDRAIQFHGGRGYSGALPFERRWRDVRSGALAHGTSELMHVTAGRTLWPGRGGGRAGRKSPGSAT